MSWTIGGKHYNYGYDIGEWALSFEINVYYPFTIRVALGCSHSRRVAVSSPMSVAAAAALTG